MKKLLFYLFLFINLYLAVYPAVLTSKEGHFDGINDIARYPFANIAISCANDETIIMWDLTKNKTLKTFELYKGALTCLAISSSGQYFVVGSKSGAAHIFSFDMKKLIDSPKLHNGKINSIVFSDKENVFISAGIDGNLSIYDIDKKSIVKGVTMPSKIISMDISPDKKIIAAGDDGGTIYLIPTSDYTVTSSYKEQTNWVSGITFSPDGKLIASVNWDLSMNIYSLEKNMNIKKVPIPTEKPLSSISWSLDNKYIVITSSDSNIYIYDAQNYKLSMTLEGHKKQVTKAIFFPDSNTLLSVSADASLKGWDISNPDDPQLTKSFSGY